jgi:hypothetical protein
MRIDQMESRWKWVVGDKMEAMRNNPRHDPTLTERKIALHWCKWVHFPSTIIDLGVFFSCGDREMKRPMKRFED